MLLAFVALIYAADTRKPTAAPLAQPVPLTVPSELSSKQLIAGVGSLGRLLYAFDRAAWVSSDALTAAVPQDQLTGAGGYVVEARNDHTLHVTYYRGAAVAARAFFVADVDEGKVVHDELLVQPVPLTPEQMILARAREVAAEKARELSYTPCTPLPFNTVVVPLVKDGPVAVYLMSAQQDAATYVMGGNYRVIVAPSGQVLTSRAYNVSCLNLALPKLPPGATPMGFMVNHLLDAIPTEIHVFASYSLHMPVFVITPDKRTWKVQGSEITQSSAK